MTTVFVKGKLVEVDPTAAEELIDLRARNAELASCLEEMIPLLELAFAAEGDTFGMEHNHATDVLLEAERLVAKR